MSLWGSKNLANNAPKSATNVRMGGNPQYGATGNNTVQFGSGVVNLPASQAALAALKGTHTGWNHITVGVGPIIGMVITTPGTNFANGDTVAFSGGQSNALATITTTPTGNVASLSFNGTTRGRFANTVSVTQTVASANGSGLVVALTLGGRAGRVHYESLVATGSAVANGSAGEFSGLPV